MPSGVRTTGTPAERHHRPEQVETRSVVVCRVEWSDFGSRAPAIPTAAKDAAGSHRGVSDARSAETLSGR